MKSCSVLPADFEPANNRRQVEWNRRREYAGSPGTGFTAVSPGVLKTKGNHEIKSKSSVAFKIYTLCNGDPMANVCLLVGLLLMKADTVFQEPAKDIC